MTGILFSSASVVGSVLGASVWFLPALLAAVAYYKYDEIDPESRPIDRARLYKEYDFIIKPHSVNQADCGFVVEVFFPLPPPLHPLPPPKTNIGLASTHTLLSLQPHPSFNLPPPSPLPPPPSSPLI
ncbi:hypothetical protein Pcinc_044032 [Petrolisthes cinctipes]|uniref:Uncharacterized protein n=1 Tax=Petrolisthes cinctipes TaxID=88211 RepID=A0AAE1BFG3_PETCI|nr:hypothetical protein Pcinc_044032 [Petrolisthes cinctipes]